MAYIPTEWKNGDVITAEKLNKIENGIKDVKDSLDITDADSGWILTSSRDDAVEWVPLKQLIPPMGAGSSIKSLVAIDSSDSLMWVPISEVLDILFYPTPSKSSVWTYDVNDGYQWLSYSALPLPSPSY